MVLRRLLRPAWGAAACCAFSSPHEPARAPPTPARTKWNDLSLEELRLRQAAFAADRDWDQFHTPRNLMLALTGEVGELAEIFQWKGEVAPGVPELSAAEKAHLGQELSDVLMYLVRLADVCDVDLPAAALDKIEHNGRKYPADRARGSSAKYTAYATTDAQQDPNVNGPR